MKINLTKCDVLEILAGHFRLETVDISPYTFTLQGQKLYSGTTIEPTSDVLHLMPAILLTSH